MPFSQTTNAEKIQRSKSVLKNLLDSPLSRQLLFFFFFLPLIEAVFIGVLCYDINGSEQTADREFLEVKTCHEFSGVIESVKFLSWAVYDFNQKDANDEAATARFHEWEPEFLKRSEAAARDLKVLIAYNPQLKSMWQWQTVNELDSSAKATMSATPDTVHEKYKNWQQALEDSYLLFETLMDEARKAIAAEKPKQPLFGLDPITVIYVAGIVNGLFAIVFALFVEMRITGPISRLARDCQKLKSGEVIEAPKKNRSEIDSLHQSVFQMAKQIAEDNKRRSSYLELLQAVQTAALMKVNSWLEKVLEFNCEPHARRSLDKSRVNISTLIEILTSMTDALSSPTNNKVVLHCRNCNTSKLAQDAVASVESLMEQRQLKLKIENDDINLYADPTLLGRVLLNFLSNAAKYSPEQGEILLTIKISGDDALVSVKDYGPGIAESEKSKLFQKFSQLKAADGVKRAGTGLGLLICKEIVEAHGGEIGCDSVQGGGSTFWFQIPTKAAEKMQGAAQLDSGKRAGIFTKYGSIKLQLGAILVLFVGLQVFLLFDLNSTFKQSGRTAQKFAEERSVILETQGFYALFLLGNKAARAQELDEYTESLKEGMKRVQALKLRFPQDSPIRKKLIEITARQRYLMKIIDYINANPDKLATLAFELARRVETTIDQIEERIYKIFAMQKETFSASYEGTKLLRERLLALLALAALADLIVIAGAAYVALRIIERVNLLKMKAEEFAAGRQIAASLDGNDELSLLDGRLCEASDAIKQAESEKQELMAVINHDLRAPLSSILGSLEILSQGVYGQLAEEPAEILSRSEHQLQILLRQINDLLMLEKIDSGTYELAKDKLSLHAILEESLNTLKSETRDKKVSVDLPAQPDGAVVEGDKQLLLRLCSIVLANAISASPSNGQVMMSVKKSDDSLVAEIKDCGPGIAPQLKEQIFDRFRFVDGKPLTGLGLPLAYRLCRMHGGTIDLQSEPAGGTKVSITLPLVL